MFRGGQQAALARGTTRRFRGTGVNAQGRIERPSGNEDAEEETDEASSQKEHKDEVNNHDELQELLHGQKVSR